MNRIFADACYWIALLHRKDELHKTATEARNRLKHAHVITTDEVLAEVLNFFGGGGQELRTVAVQVVENLRKDKDVTVVEQSRATFDAGLDCYKKHNDKSYSLPDCVSFELMNRDSITDALTNDRHFEQAGFNALLRQST